MKKQFPILKRGESSLVTKRKHIPTWLFKQSANLSKQQKAIEQILSDINPINAGKKRDEALALLAQFFPKAESHMGQMKKYDATLKYLTQENSAYKKEINDSKASIKERLEVGTLKQENEQLQRFINSIPQEMMNEIKFQQRQVPQKGRYDRDLICTLKIEYFAARRAF